MGSYLARRVLQLAVVLFGISTILFFVLRATGDPAAMLAGQNATPEAVAQIRRALGFDDPLPIQYARFMGDVVRLRFGDSITTKQDAMGMVAQRIPPTLLLTFAAFALASVVALPVGMYSALRPRTFGSGLATLGAFLGQSVPSFWLGIVLVLVFAVNLRWLPPFGAGEPRHLVLPAVTLAALPLAKLVRLTRSGMLDVLHQDYVRTAHAKGVPARLVLLRHCLRNMLIPIVTVIGVDLGQLLGGAVITETIFSWPGVGRLMVDSVSGRDFPVVQATVFVIAVLVVLINLVIDLLYRQLDPRVKLT